MMYMCAEKMKSRERLHTSVVDENVDGAVLVQRVLDEVLSVGSLGHMTHEAADCDPLILVGLMCEQQPEQSVVCHIT
jgi:hypothetical protein